MWNAIESFLGFPVSVQVLLIVCWLGCYGFLCSQTKLSLWLDERVEQQAREKYPCEFEQLTGWLSSLDYRAQLTGTRLIIMDEKEVVEGDRVFLSHLNDFDATNMPWVIRNKLNRVRHLILEGQPTGRPLGDILYCLVVAPVLALLMTPIAVLAVVFCTGGAVFYALFALEVILGMIFGSPS